MKTIEETYAPFNYSTSRCYVMPIEITQSGYHKIERKLPNFIKELKAVFITAAITNSDRYVGIISLNFNGDAFKSVLLPVYKSLRMPDSTIPIPLNETLKPNSFLQGYYYDMGGKAFPYRISIYLHYTPVL